MYKGWSRNKLCCLYFKNSVEHTSIKPHQNPILHFQHTYPITLATFWSTSGCPLSWVSLGVVIKTKWTQTQYHGSERQACVNTMGCLHPHDTAASTVQCLALPQSQNDFGRSVFSVDPGCWNGLHRTTKDTWKRTPKLLQNVAGNMKKSCLKQRGLFSGVMYVSS